MITGIVNANREATIHLTVQGPGGQEQETEAVIDTGFNGSLTLPPAFITVLGLTWLTQGRAMLGDGRVELFDVTLIIVPSGHLTRIFGRMGFQERREGWPYLPFSHSPILPSPQEHPVSRGRSGRMDDQCLRCLCGYGYMGWALGSRYGR